MDPNGWFYASIAVDSNNYPHISYFDNGNTDAKYAFWNGSGFQLETVASVDDIGREIVLTMDPYDNPVMAFYEDTHQYLFSVLRNASGWQVEYVMGGLSSGYGLSTKVDVYGMQMITFFNPIYQYLGLACRYSTGWHFDAIDINHDCGYQSSLALYYTGSPPEAHKCISYRDEATKTLKYFYEDYYGSSISTIDQDGDVGEYSSLAIQNGTQDWEIHPHISYFDRGNGHLKYAYYPSPTPAATATPGGLTCDIYTNQAYFHPHDNFSLILAITNPGPPISQDVYIVLDISGDYWFWPGWKHYPPDTDHQLWIVPTGTTTDNPMQFTWPDITSSGSGIVFHGATLDPGSNNLRSYDSCLFGYGP